MLHNVNNNSYPVYVRKAKSQDPIFQKTQPSTRTELQYLRGYPKHRYVQQAAPARYGPSCKSKINANE